MDALLCKPFVKSNAFAVKIPCEPFTPRESTTALGTPSEHSNIKHSSMTSLPCLQTIDTTSLPDKTSYSCSLGSTSTSDNNYRYSYDDNNNRKRRRSLLQINGDAEMLGFLTRGTGSLAGASALEIAETNGQLLKRLGRQFANPAGLGANRWDTATGRQDPPAVGSPHRRRWLAEQQSVTTPLVSGTGSTQASTVSQATVALPGGLRDCCKANPDCTDQLSVIVTHIDYSAAIQGLAGLNLLGLGSVRVVSSMVSVLFTSSAGTPVALSCAAHPFEVTVPLQSQLYVPGAPGTTECWELQQNGTSLTGTTSQQTTLLSVVGGTATCAPTNAGEHQMYTLLQNSGKAGWHSENLRLFRI